MRVVIVGGGYAGLACLLRLRRSYPAADLHLVDAREQHIRLTKLHQTLHRPLQEIAEPFSKLAQKFGFSFHQDELRFDVLNLSELQQARQIAVRGKKLDFHALVVATGARTRDVPVGQETATRESLLERQGTELLDQLFCRIKGRTAQIVVVGGGATGLQFLFELRDILSAQSAPVELTLIDYEERLLGHLPGDFDRYLRKRLDDAGLNYLPGIRFVGQDDERIFLEHVASGESLARACDLAFLFPGVVAVPHLLDTNRYGQVLEEGLPLENIFAAGDCSLFLSSGLNAQTAQAAMRKGSLVAENIGRLSEGRRFLPYLHRELGYFVSLGDRDGIGWMGLRENVLTGISAFAIKEVLEAQYDLFLRGINTYF